MKLVRLNVNMNEETAAVLREFASGRGLTITETVRRAVAVLKFVSDEQKAGRKIQTMDRNGRNKREWELL